MKIVRIKLNNIKEYHSTLGFLERTINGTAAKIIVTDANDVEMIWETKLINILAKRLKQNDKMIKAIMSRTERTGKH